MVQNEILRINNTVYKQEQWLKPFLALFLVTFNNLYSNVKIKIKDYLKVALKHPQIRNWLGKYPVSKNHYNTYDTKKSVVLARKLPYTLNIIHPYLGLSYLRLNQILSKASEGKLEISVTNVREEEYHISCRLTMPDIEPIISYAIGIQGYEFTPNLVPFLPTKVIHYEFNFIILVILLYAKVKCILRYGIALCVFSENK